MSSTSSSHTIVSESVGLEPIDYEEYVSNHSERDPLSQVGQPTPLFYPMLVTPPLQLCYPLHSGVCRVRKKTGFSKKKPAQFYCFFFAFLGL